MTQEPTAPDSLPKYIADGMPKQDEETLEDIILYANRLLEYRRRDVGDEHLPENVERVDFQSPEKEVRGTVVKEKVKCGDKSCHCMKGGELHGDYLYRYYYKDGKLRSEYIGKPENVDVQGVTDST